MDIVVAKVFQIILLPPANKVGEDNVFTGASHSVHTGGGGLSLVPCPFQGVSLVIGPFCGWVCSGEHGTWDTISKWVVRILLECFLVISY